MKKLILLFCLLAFASSVNSQAASKKIYCKFTARSFFTDYSAELDTGRLNPLTKIFLTGERIYDENGKEIRFNSEISILNFFALKGWVLVDTYTEVKEKSSTIYYIMSYDLQDDEDIDGVYTDLTGRTYEQVQKEY